MSSLKVDGARLVDSEGKEVVLHGAGLGGWMWYIREALEETIGKEKAEFFFDKYLEHFFADPDAEFFRSLGLNCIRIAVTYRSFEDDLNPRVLKPNCFKHLDRAIALCAKHSIYTVIDLHTAPGGQSGGWHADGGHHYGSFWKHKDFQGPPRLAGNPWIAGYNLLNEPADPHPRAQGPHLDILTGCMAAVRAIDGEHILFLDWEFFPEDAGSRWTNTAYSIHDYAVYGFPNSPEPYEGSDAQKERLVRTYKRKRDWWGPVYARREYDGDATDEINDRRYAVLRDQLEIYEKDRLNWSIWLYKDIGFQGMVHVAPTTPYRQHFANFLARKHRLAVDAWGKDEKDVAHIYEPIENLIRDSVADPSHLKIYPFLWTVNERVSRIARTMLVAEFMVKEWADLFKGMEEAQLEELAKSFAFENCLKRDGLNEILTAHAIRVARIKD
ncbi:endoglucanase family 5 glycoside hydrolase [Ephemerocybe angulata]|uniref:Endoglucanase family 5 glycoside hydrolase n=1 Tax=Ephemerocybe angulata TaxID=980116 RepID=A0A8H6IGH9_9AGAR|nr:endoglucanase family 5 glycoside hydrolase [Tulosesus angulatus]